VDATLGRATAAGSAGLAAVGSGIWDSTLEIGEHVSVGDRIEPQRDAASANGSLPRNRAAVEAAVLRLLA
jgi:glycerol kinase